MKQFKVYNKKMLAFLIIVIIALITASMVSAYPTKIWENDGEGTTTVTYENGAWITLSTDNYKIAEKTLKGLEKPIFEIGKVEYQFNYKEMDSSDIGYSGMTLKEGTTISKGSDGWFKSFDSSIRFTDEQVNDLNSGKGPITQDGDDTKKYMVYKKDDEYIPIILETILDDKNVFTKIIYYDKDSFDNLDEASYTFLGIYVDETKEINNDGEIVAKISDEGKTTIYSTEYSETESAYKNFVFETTGKTEEKGGVIDKDVFSTLEDLSTLGELELWDSLSNLELKYTGPPTEEEEVDKEEEDVTPIKKEEQITEEEKSIPIKWPVIETDLDEGTTKIYYEGQEPIIMSTDKYNIIEELSKSTELKNIENIEVDNNILKFSKKNEEGVSDYQVIFDNFENIEKINYVKKNQEGKITQESTVFPGESMKTIFYEDEIVKKISEVETIKGGVKSIKITNYEDGEIYSIEESISLTPDNKNIITFYNDYPEEEDNVGEIVIKLGEKEIKYYGRLDYSKDGEITIKNKEGKTIANVDEQGRILTDYNKGGIPQTIHYPTNIFGNYAFGRTQKDGSEKIYWLGYAPFAFKPKSGKYEDIIYIQKEKDGSYTYYMVIEEGGERKIKELKEDDSRVKEAKAMVTKSLIGPAFDAAVKGARGGIALSNLLNTWLDWDFMMGWRKKTDEFFSETVIGRIISGKWEESVCHSKIEKIPNSVAVVNINGNMGFAAHVEGERSAAIITNNETLYFYKITFGVNPYGMGNITFELLIDGNKADLDGDGTADKIKLGADETYSGTGENAVVRYKPEIYEEVCIKFYNTENLNAEFRNALKDDKLCNKIVEAYISPGEISKPAAGTTTSVSGTSEQGW